MPTYTVTTANGAQYEVDGSSADEAHQSLMTHLGKEDYANAPLTTKARMLVDDPIRNVVHGLTAGWFDKGMQALTGANEQEQTEQAAGRIGAVPAGAARAVGAMMLPSAGPKVVSMVGGGPLAKHIVGAGVSAGEGALYGGAQSAASDEPVKQGMISGGIGGAIGQSVMDVLGNLSNKAVRAYKSVSDVPPIPKVTPLPKEPTNQQRIEDAVARAEDVGARQGDVAQMRDQMRRFAQLRNQGGFTPEQTRLMGRVVEPDWGTFAAQQGGKFLSDKLATLGIGSAAGFGAADPVTGLLTAIGSQSAGQMLKRDAAKAVQEKVDDLRRTITRTKKYVPPGPLSQGALRRWGIGAGYGAMGDINDLLNQD